METLQYKHDPSDVWVCLLIRYEEKKFSIFFLSFLHILHQNLEACSFFFNFFFYFLSTDMETGQQLNMETNLCFYVIIACRVESGSTDVYTIARWWGNLLRIFCFLRHELLRMI